MGNPGAHPELNGVLDFRGAPAVAHGVLNLPPHKCARCVEGRGSPDRSIFWLKMHMAACSNAGRATCRHMARWRNGGTYI